MRVDYQRITDEMYEPRGQREPPSRHMLIAGLVLIIALPIATVLYFLTALFSLMHELQGF